MVEKNWQVDSPGNLPGEFIEQDMERQFALMTRKMVEPGEDIDILSEIPEDAVIPLVKMKLKARIRRCDDIDYAVNQYLRLMVSRGRMGRRESVSILEKVLVALKDTVSGMRDMIRDHQ